MTRLKLCLERTTGMYARAYFIPGGFGSFDFIELEWDCVVSL